MIKVKIINKSNNKLPEYATPGSAGLDLRADIESPITLKPFERALIPTGNYIQLPHGYEGQVRPRSGLALKKGLTVLNAPGTLDEDFTGNVGVILINLGSEEQTIEPGERIAQLVISNYEQAELVEVEALEKTERGEGGYGHSGRQ